MTDATTVSGRSHGRRTQADRRDRARAELLDATQELLARNGLTGASFAKVGERAGYSRGLATHHFGTKKRLFEALLRRQRSGFLAAISELEAEPGLRRFTALLDAYIDYGAAITDVARSNFVMRSTSYPEQRGLADVSRYDEETRTIFESWIREGQRDGSIRSDLSSEIGAWSVLAFGRGLTEQLIVSPDAVDIEQLRSGAHEFLRAALAAPVDGDEAAR